MPKNIQLHIPKPCHEDWEAMGSQEKGRFCGSCRKTVVDFSLMSDREVLTYLAAAETKVCGRFSADQLQRDLLPPPDRKRKAWAVWSILLFGLLLSSRTRAQGKTQKPVSHQSAPGKTRPQPVTMGAPVPKVIGKIAAPQPLLMGDVAVAESSDTIPPPHVTELEQVVVIGYTTTKRSDIMGGLSIVTKKELDSMDTPSLLGKLIPDTLAFLGIAKKGMTLYPNPAPRGTVIRLSLNGNRPGMYWLGFYNEAGALVQTKSLDLAGKSQVELLNIPASLPGGIYFVKLSAPELKESYVQKLVVR